MRRFPLTRRLGLRARITLAFTVGALLLSVILSITTLALTRENLLNQREDAAAVIVYENAGIVQQQAGTVRARRACSARCARPSGRGRSSTTVRTTCRATRSSVRTPCPRSCGTSVLAGQPSRMRFELRGDMHLADRHPDPRPKNVAYFEIVSLGDLEDTLGALSVSLVVASIITTLAGAGIGWWASRRALRPLAGVSTAATALAAGRLDTRLESSDDPDLRPIAESFNDMAQALQDRIESDARFASDVSHELRSPLMTLAASIEVMDNQRDELPERSRAALDLMVADIDRFRQLVEDLLEISRFDAGVVRLELEEVHLAELVMQAVSHSTDADVPVELDAELAGVVVQADKRRIVRVIANLLDNAAKYGGGATSVSLRQVDDGVQIAVEDRGDGRARGGPRA